MVLDKRRQRGYSKGNEGAPYESKEGLRGGTAEGSKY